MHDHHRSLLHEDGEGGGLPDLPSIPTPDRVRQNSVGNLLADPEAVSSSEQPALRKPSFPDCSADVAGVEVEDAYAEIGGLGRYQAWHMGVCVCFWFFNVGTAMSVFANVPWCIAEGSPALCVGPDLEVAKSPEVFWSDCRSPSCQFDLRPAFCGGTADGTGAVRQLHSESQSLGQLCPCGSPGAPTLTVGLLCLWVGLRAQQRR
jgi:hypothetical protein